MRRVQPKCTHTHTHKHTPVQYFHVIFHCVDCLHFNCVERIRGEQQRECCSEVLQQPEHCSMCDKELCVCVFVCKCICVCGDIILMLPDGVLQQFHIKAEPSGETARYKLLKQHNKTVRGRAVCACLCACVCIIYACNGSECHCDSKSTI